VACINHAQHRLEMLQMYWAH